MHVLKFGGTSMGNEHTWRKILEIVAGYERATVVVSATARTTRKLVAAAELAGNDLKGALSIASEIKERHGLLIKNFMGHYPEIQTNKVVKNCELWIEQCVSTLEHHLEDISEAGVVKPELKDAVASIGEQLSSRLFSYCGKVYGLNTRWVDARKVIKTDSDFGNAKPNRALINTSSRIIAEELQQGVIPVMGGYYGEDSDGNITTLGFEGSDFSASLIGAALDASAIEIWTDVSGIYTCDPRVVENARPIRQLSFQEATEMAYFGAKVLHPSTMNPAGEKQIPIYVKNIFEPDHPGTKIQGESPADGPVKAMTFLNEVVIFTVTSPHTKMGYEFLAAVFDILKKYHMPVNTVTTTEASVSVALELKRMNSNFFEDLEQLGRVKRKDNQGIVSLIGCNIHNPKQISDKILGAIGDREVSMLSFSSTKRNMNIVLDEQHITQTVRAIHDSLFKSSGI